MGLFRKKKNPEKNRSFFGRVWAPSMPNKAGESPLIRPEDVPCILAQLSPEEKKVQKKVVDTTEKLTAYLQKELSKYKKTIPSIKATIFNHELNIEIARALAFSLEKSLQHSESEAREINPIEFELFVRELTIFKIVCHWLAIQHSYVGEELTTKIASVFHSKTKSLIPSDYIAAINIQVNCLHLIFLDILKGIISGKIEEGIFDAVFNRFHWFYMGWDGGKVLPIGDIFELMRAMTRIYFVFTECYLDKLIFIRENINGMSMK